MELARLRTGITLRGDCGNPPDQLPAWMNEESYEQCRRGQQFFQKHCAAVLFALYGSLTVGFVVERLLDVLVLNKESNTSKKAFRRYDETFGHVILWHTTNIWDWQTPSYGHKSLTLIRRVHGRVSKALNETGSCAESASDHKRDSVYLSQYDMALVQAGFIAEVIEHPEYLGIYRPSRQELEDYVFLWRCIGYLLGIDDEYNICSRGFETALEICKSIESEIVLPGLYHPPPEFHRISDAFIDGNNRGGVALGLFPKWLRPNTKESIVAYNIYMMTGSFSKLPDWLRLGCGGWIRVGMMMATVFMSKWCPGFERLLNRMWMQLYWRVAWPAVQQQFEKKNFDMARVALPLTIGDVTI